MNNNSPHLPDAIKLNWVDIIAPDWRDHNLKHEQIQRKEKESDEEQYTRNDVY